MRGMRDDHWPIGRANWCSLLWKRPLFLFFPSFSNAQSSLCSTEVSWTFLHSFFSCTLVSSLLSLCSGNHVGDTSLSFQCMCPCEYVCVGGLYTLVCASVWRPANDIGVLLYRSINLFFRQGLRRRPDLTCFIRLPSQ